MRKYFSVFAAVVISFTAGEAYAKRTVRAKSVNTQTNSEQKHFRLIRGKLQPVEVADFATNHATLDPRQAALSARAT
jgi:hypothetical protein